MRLRFRVQYHTSWGQSLYVCGSPEDLGAWSVDHAQAMNYLADGYWELSLDLKDPGEHLTYKFFIRHEYGGGIEWEFGENRKVMLPDSAPEELVIQDEWRSARHPDVPLFSDLFTDVLLRRGSSRSASKQGADGPFLHTFQVYAPNVKPDQVLGVLGNDLALGAWNAGKALVLSDEQFPLWSGTVALDDPDAPAEYKFVILDKKSKNILSWEHGHNRFLAPEYSRSQSRRVIITAEGMRNQAHSWRGAGVAIPVFSLRSRQSTGIGELSDLKLLIDWASGVGLRMIQILPINDTIANHTWTDSYPYAAISVFALNPNYVNLEQMGLLQNAEADAWWREKREQLNRLPEVDLEAVMQVKSQYFKLLFDQDWQKVRKRKAFKQFFEANKHWLVHYAVFCYLRDRFGTVEFAQWPQYSQFDEAEVQALADPGAAHYEDIAIHYFIQFHLDQQMNEVKAYARKKRVGIKGDIPIGIYRHSVDAWVSPEQVNMGGQAGAPPDAFAKAGQNWGFPTYDWHEMAKDGYKWWKQRLTQLATYVDAFRIDHILGFFRIWEIPWEQVQGIMGQFNPALPFYRDELQHRGFWLDDDRFVRPYIREHFLGEFFGEMTEPVKREFLVERPNEPGRYDFKPEFSTQRQISNYLNAQVERYPESREFYQQIEEGLFGLVAQVIFLPYPGSDGQAFSPRIAMHFTKSFQELDPGTKALLDELYVDFFYHRHEQFWRDQAMIKLPALKQATNMLVCGEDLGMVPECVPGVMEELGILSLEIQRMPKASDKLFDHPADAPYLSVISTSTHDMPTLRGWWESDPEATRRFYHEIMGGHGDPPFFCEPWVARDILMQHLYSPAMWAILPIQDLLAIDGDIRREIPLEEQINDPSNPTHYWRYRFHMNMEDLIEARDFNQLLSGLIAASGRG